MWVELPLTADVSQPCSGCPSVVSSQLCTSADLALPGCGSAVGLLLPFPISVVTSAGSLRALSCFGPTFFPLAAPRLPP